MRHCIRGLFPLVWATLASGSAWAHHSHALFDMSHSASVAGTVAKLEWTNPHIFLWLYVPDSTQKNGYQLYAFESGSVALMARAGWDHGSLAAGEKVSVKYMPLRDGRSGGAILQVTRANGKTLSGDPLIVQASQGPAKERP
jgi:hypothetical protein